MLDRDGAGVGLVQGVVARLTSTGSLNRCTDASVMQFDLILHAMQLKAGNSEIYLNLQKPDRKLPDRLMQECPAVPR